MDKDLNVRLETIKLLEETTGGKLNRLFRFDTKRKGKKSKN